MPTGVNEFCEKLVPRVFVGRERVDVAAACFQDASPPLSELDALVAWKRDAVPQALERGVDFGQQATDASVVVDRRHLARRRHVVVRLQ